MVGNHHEKVQFNLIQSSKFPVVLGFPWLSHQSPIINWSSGTVVEWGPNCKLTCLLSRAMPPVPKPPSSLEFSQVPSKYHDLSEVFSKRRATSLPPHTPFDCNSAPSRVRPSTRKNLLLVTSRDSSYGGIYQGLPYSRFTSAELNLRIFRMAIETFQLYAL